MCDEWMPQLRYGLTKDEFDTLPRNPATLIDDALPRFRKKIASAVYQRLRPPTIIDGRSKNPNGHKIEIRRRRVRKP